MAMTKDQQEAMEDLFTSILIMSADVDKEAEKVLEAGRNNPLSDDEAKRLLTVIVKQLLTTVVEQLAEKHQGVFPETDAEIEAYVDKVSLGMVEKRLKLWK